MAFNKPKTVKDELSKTTANGSDEIYSRSTSENCNPCSKGGTVNKANAFCTLCLDFLCERCKVQHLQTFTDHDIITDNLGHCKTFLDLTKKCSIAKQELIQTKNEAENNTKLAELYRDNAMEAIKAERENIDKMFERKKEELHAELDNLEKEIKDIIETKYTSDLENFQTIIEDTESFETDLEKIIPNLEIQPQSLHEDNFISTMTNCKQELTKIKPWLREATSRNEVTKYRFEPKWEQNYTKMEIKRLGAIQVLDSTKATSAVTHSLDINVRSPLDTDTCSIRGMCFLSKNFLVVVDSQNNCLKVLEREKFQVVSQVLTQTGPHDVTRVKDNQIAVTFPSHRMIQVLSMTKSNSLTKSHDIAFDGACRGIAYNHGKLVVSSDFPGQIQILDINGSVLQKIELGHPVKTLTGWTSYTSIGLSPDHKMIYIADYEQDTVTCMTLKGKVRAIYRNRHLEKPLALTVDSKGFVYVSGLARVHELSPDLSQGRILLDRTHKIHSVQCLLHCDTENALYVGMLLQDTIKVFNIL